MAAGVEIRLPENYFPNDDSEREPVMNWRSCAHLLYGNWLNYCVYQSVPYDPEEIKKGVRTAES